MKEYYDHSFFSTCTESSEYFLKNDCDCKAVEALDIFEKLSWLKGCCFEGILQLFTNFYLHRKVSVFLRNDSDCKDVNIYNYYHTIILLSHYNGLVVLSYNKKCGEPGSV